MIGSVRCRFVTPDFDFDRETAVVAVAEHRYEATLDRSWWVHRGPNGGYLAAIVMRAFEATVDDPGRSARSLTIHYAAPPGDGNLSIATRVERAGRSLTSCSARLEQDGQLVGLALAAFSAPRPGPEFCDRQPPRVPRPEELPEQDQPANPHVEIPPIARRWEYRWAFGQPGSEGEEARSGGWLRLPEGHVADAAVVAAMTDAWVPPLFARHDAPTVVVPTVDLTVHFRTALPHAGARPDDWVLASFRTDVAAEGFLEEDGELWSTDGTLLAQSRQLAAMLPLGPPG